MLFFFFNDPATTEISPLPLHDALPISGRSTRGRRARVPARPTRSRPAARAARSPARASGRRSPAGRSEEHTSELQSRQYLVCRLLLEKKKKDYIIVKIILTTTVRRLV